MVCSCKPSGRFQLLCTDRLSVDSVTETLLATILENGWSSKFRLRTQVHHYIDRSVLEQAALAGIL